MINNRYVVSLLAKLLIKAHIATQGYQDSPNCVSVVGKPTLNDPFQHSRHLVAGTFHAYRDGGHSLAQHEVCVGEVVLSQLLTKGAVDVLLPYEAEALQDDLNRVLGASHAGTPDLPFVCEGVPFVPAEVQGALKTLFLSSSERILSIA